MIKYTGQVPHKILHLTILPPKEITLVQAQTEIGKLQKLGNFPKNFCSDGLAVYFNKLVLHGSLSPSFPAIEHPHITILEFETSEHAKNFLITNKEMLSNLLNLYFQIEHIACVTKGIGPEITENIC